MKSKTENELKMDIMNTLDKNLKNINSNNIKDDTTQFIELAANLKNKNKKAFDLIYELLQCMQ